MTIQQLQDYINTKPDIRGLINVIVDYIQNNPGGGGATPTLDEVLEAGATLTANRTINLNAHTLSFGTPLGTVDFAGNGIDNTGNINMAQGSVLNMKSPDGTIWAISVANDGTLTVIED